MHFEQHLNLLKRVNGIYTVCVTNEGSLRSAERVMNDHL